MLCGVTPLIFMRSQLPQATQSYLGRQFRDTLTDTKSNKGGLSEAPPGANECNGDLTPIIRLKRIHSRRFH
jgi:hypothetical protein